MQRRRFSEPDHTREFPRTRIELIELAGRTVARVTYEPGWQWSRDMRPAMGMDTCLLHHVGVTLRGRLRVRSNGGEEIEFGPGEAFDITPGHDGWVVGDEPYVAVDFEGFG